MIPHTSPRQRSSPLGSENRRTAQSLWVSLSVGALTLALLPLGSSAAVADAPAVDSHSATLSPGSEVADLEDEGSSSSGAELMIKVGDSAPVPLVLDDLLSPVPEDQGAGPRGPALYLIDNSAAWSACFGPFLDPDFTLQSYTVNAWNLGKFTANLTCGNSISKSSGWHHIQARHQPQWQARLDDANAAGAGPADTWDDLMALVTGTVLTDPWWYTKEYDGKRCFTQEVLVFRKDDGMEIFRAWPSVVVSMSSHQIVTSYASKSQDCTRYAPWA